MVYFICVVTWYSREHLKWQGLKDFRLCTSPPIAALALGWQRKWSITLMWLGMTRMRPRRFVNNCLRQFEAKNIPILLAWTLFNQNVLSKYGWSDARVVAFTIWILVYLILGLFPTSWKKRLPWTNAKGRCFVKIRHFHYNNGAPFTTILWIWCNFAEFWLLLQGFKYLYVTPSDFKKVRVSPLGPYRVSNLVRF